MSDVWTGEDAELEADGVTAVTDQEAPATYWLYDRTTGTTEPVGEHRLEELRAEEGFSERYQLTESATEAAEEPPQVHLWTGDDGKSYWSLVGTDDVSNGYANHENARKGITAKLGERVGIHEVSLEEATGTPAPDQPPGGEQ